MRMCMNIQVQFFQRIKNFNDKILLYIFCLFFLYKFIHLLVLSPMY